MLSVSVLIWSNSTLSVYLIKVLVKYPEKVFHFIFPSELGGFSQKPYSRYFIMHGRMC